MKSPKTASYLFCVPVVASVLLLGLLYHRANAAPAPQSSPEIRDRSIRAFRAAASVITSPRCVNCHISNEGPLQGDDSHPHAMNVKRGPDGRGTVALRCAACHQSENSSFLHGPPGATDWRIPPPQMPLAWKGLSVSALCNALKDPSKNGRNRSVQDLIPYEEASPLVHWAFNPGPGRTVPPLSYEEFVAKLKEWVDTGAACPE